MPLTAGVITESYTLDTYRNSHGFALLISDNATTPVFHAIAGLGDVDGPNRSRNVIERNTHSTTGGYVGKDPGTKNAGELKVTVAFDPSNMSHSHDATLNSAHPFGLGWLYDSGAKRLMHYATPKPVDVGGYEVFEFRGWISELGEAYPVEGRMDRTVTIQIDGGITQLADSIPV
jgi:hypothetical protein